MNGVYGTVKPARIKASDVDIFYSYSPSRATDDVQYSTFKRLNSEYLLPTYTDEEPNHICSAWCGFIGESRTKIPLL